MRMYARRDRDLRYLAGSVPAIGRAACGARVPRGADPDRLRSRRAQCPQLLPGDGLQRGIPPQALRTRCLYLGQRPARRARDGLQLRTAFQPPGDHPAKQITLLGREISFPFARVPARIPGRVRRTVLTHARTLVLPLRQPANAIITHA
jgi:hypothetical protein